MRNWLLKGIALTLALGCSPILAQDFPVPGKSIRIMVGLPAGGGSDAQARIVAQKMQEKLGVPVVVENRPGASMMIAANDVRRAEPDGHTLLYTPASALVVNPHTLSNVSYDPFTDFTPLSVAASGPIVLVAHNSVPGKNLQEVLAHARANPGTLNFASFGTGSSSHLFGEMLARKGDVNIVHVPYKGAGDVQKDLIPGRVQLMFAAASGAVMYEGSGQVRMLAVAEPRRTSLLPNVPTLAEEGIDGIDLQSWVGFFGPKDMPPATVQRLNQVLVEVLADPKVRTDFASGAYEAISSSPEALRERMKRDYAKWDTFVQQLGMEKL